MIDVRRHHACETEIPIGLLPRPEVYVFSHVSISPGVSLSVRSITSKVSTILIRTFKRL